MPDFGLLASQIRALHQQQVFQVAQLCEQEMNLARIMEDPDRDQREVCAEIETALRFKSLCASCRHMPSTGRSSGSSWIAS